MDIINQGCTSNCVLLATEMCFYVSLWGKKKSVRPWVSPLMHIIRVFLETSKPFCCHWSCSNRGCLSMQSSGGGISSQQLTQVQLIWLSSSIGLAWFLLLKQHSLGTLSWLQVMPSSLELAWTEICWMIPSEEKGIWAARGFTVSGIVSSKFGLKICSVYWTVPSAELHRLLFSCKARQAEVFVW